MMLFILIYNGFWLICYNSNKIVSFLSDSVISELRDIYPDILHLGELSLPDSLSRIKDKTGQSLL